MDTYSAIGYFSTSKKSADRRWWSRVASPVSIELGSMVTCTDAWKGSSGTVTVPEKVLKPPLTLEIIRWRTENSMLECEGSMFQVPAGSVVVVEVLVFVMVSFSLDR